MLQSGKRQKKMVYFSYLNTLPCKKRDLSNSILQMDSELNTSRRLLQQFIIACWSIFKANLIYKNQLHFYSLCVHPCYIASVFLKKKRKKKRIGQANKDSFFQAGPSKILLQFVQVFINRKIK